MNRFRTRVKSLFLCFLSAGMLIVSFPSFNIWPLAWLAFVPLFFVLQNKSKLKAFLWAYLAGVIFWSGTIYWLVHVTLLGTIILILYLALHFAIFGLFFSTLNFELPTLNCFLIPSAWVLLEYIRSHLFTGFPWGLLGYSQYLNLAVIQIADITGAWGVSFLVMMVNGWFYSLIRAPDRQSICSIRRSLPVIGCLLAVFGYGYYHLTLTPFPHHLSTLKISVVQGNIPQEIKWDPQASLSILSKYIRLTEEAAKDNPELIIWPEAANPLVGSEEEGVFDRIQSLAGSLKIPLLFGSVIVEGDSFFNSALLVDATGKNISRYDKLHLVPFGEYIPFRRAFPYLATIAPIGDITAGRDYTVFYLKKHGKPANRPTKFSVLICFEDLFPELSRQFVRRGAQFLVNITNDAWYKKTSAPFQHFQASVFRAVENRVFLVRSANTGVSGFISPSGRIISLVSGASRRNIFVDGISAFDISLVKPHLSFYTRYGDKFIFSLFILIAFYGIFLFLRKK